MAETTYEYLVVYEDDENNDVADVILVSPTMVLAENEGIVRAIAARQIPEEYATEDRLPHVVTKVRRFEESSVGTLEYSKRTSTITTSTDIINGPFTLNNWKVISRSDLQTPTYDLKNGVFWGTYGGGRIYELDSNTSSSADNIRKTTNTKPGKFLVRDLADPIKRTIECRTFVGPNGSFGVWVNPEDTTAGVASQIAVAAAELHSKGTLFVLPEE